LPASGAVFRWPAAGDEGWAVLDEISPKYTGQPYGRDQERIIGLMEVDSERIGLG